MEEVEASFKVQIHALLDAGVDLLLFETFSTGGTSAGQ